VLNSTVPSVELLSETMISMSGRGAVLYMDSKQSLMCFIALNVTMTIDKYFIFAKL